MANAKEQKRRNSVAYVASDGLTTYTGNVLEVGVVSGKGGSSVSPMSIEEQSSPARQRAPEKG